jgi:hypothetical protein
MGPIFKNVSGIAVKKGGLKTDTRPCLKEVVAHYGQVQR